MSHSENPFVRNTLDKGFLWVTLSVSWLSPRGRGFDSGELAVTKQECRRDQIGERIARI